MRMSILKWFGIGRARSALDDFVSQMESGDDGSARVAQASNLRELLEDKCPWCKKSLQDHEYFHLTTIRFEGQDRKEKQQSVVEKLKTSNWAGCAAMTEMSVDTDSLDAYLIRCPEERIGWTLRMTPYEYLHRSELIATEEVREEQRGSLSVLKELKGCWLPLA